MPTPLMRHFQKILAEAPGGGGCAVSPGSVLRACDLDKAAMKLVAMPKPLVGIVCKPKLYVAVSVEAAKNAHPMFGAVPVFSKPDQVEDCLAFYDVELLKKHLSPNAVVSQPGQNLPPSPTPRENPRAYTGWPVAHG